MRRARHGDGLLEIARVARARDGLLFDRGEEGGGEAVSSMEEEISVALLEALVEDLKMERTESGVASVSFGFGQK